ncbi:hypothetical protein AB5I41_09570 [Sphingomonas sp. MMS24-JH45]
MALAEVFPARRASLLARGARYGDNRVVCGVHHPIDVERGRAVARIVFAAAAERPRSCATLRVRAARRPARHRPSRASASPKAMARR